MGTTFRPCYPEQKLLPSPLVDRLSENRLMVFLQDLGAELALDKIHAYHRQKDPSGEKAYDPRTDDDGAAHVRLLPRCAQTLNTFRHTMKS